MPRLYSRNSAVAKAAVELLSQHNITRFHSQNSLYIFLEDIKNPNLKNARERFNKKSPYYHPGHNYEPIVNFLSNQGILKHNVIRQTESGYPLQYEVCVDKQAVEEFLTKVF